MPPKRLSHNPRLKVLIFHGYLLRGTGSNVYNANVARALARLGHEVHLLCQDREAAALPWVDAVARPGAGPVAGTGPGTVTVHVPDIGGLLPVYVADRYEGFEAKTFPELSDAELDRYLDANVAAVRAVVEMVGGVDAALANHLVMGPAIAARAGLGAGDGGPGYAVKVHGSALEFTVKPNPRFLPYAREGIDAASGVLAGSRHTAESLWAALGDPELPARTRLGPPGVDVEAFAPIPRPGAPGGGPDRAAGATRVEGGSAGDRVERDGVASRLASLAGELRGAAAEPAAAFARDPAEAAAAVEHLAAASGPRVVFVGKLIDTKGVDLLLAAWPLVAGRHPGARLLIAGFGEGRERIEALAAALAAGDLSRARELAGGTAGGGPAPAVDDPAAGVATAPGARGGATPWRMLGAFLASPPPGYAGLAGAGAGSVAFAGRLEHDEVARLVPACDALVMPSTFAEAFGMVAAEAAAAGVLPVSAAHSGMLEVSDALAARLPREARELVSFPLGDGAVAAIADRLDRWLSLDPATARATREALSTTAQRLWSWEGVANGVLAASRGHLDELPAVPG